MNTTTANTVAIAAPGKKYNIDRKSDIYVCITNTMYICNKCLCVKYSRATY